MINLISSELIKLKKSFIIPIAILSAIIIPAGFFVSNLNMDYITIIRTTSALDILANINIMQGQFLNMILFSLIGGYIFAREHVDKTANVLYSYPVSKVKIFMSKFIVFFILIILVYTLNLIGILITIGSALGIDEVKNILVIELKICVYSELLQILIIPLTILISIISKNVIVPVIYGVAAAVTSMFMMMTGVYMQLSPFMIPVLPFYYFLMGNPIDYIAVILSGGSIFIISIAAIIIYVRNCDVN